MAEDYGTRIERKFMAHYISVSSETPKWERLGKDLEEFTINMNADSEDKKNILGETNPTISGYAPTAEISPYYARKGTDLYTWLQDVIDNRKALDDLKVLTCEVHLWDEKSGETSGTYPAFEEVAYVEPTSYGGDTTGYQIPFTLHYTGERTKGTFAVATKTFTAANA